MGARVPPADAGVYGSCAGYAGCARRTPAQPATSDTRSATRDTRRPINDQRRYNPLVSFAGKLRFVKTMLFGGGTMLKVGDLAPDFDVSDHNGRRIKLSELRGRKIILWFYPKADTPG